MVAIRGGYRIARGWHYAKLSLSRALFSYIFLICALCYCFFILVVFVLFLFRFVLMLRWSFVDVQQTTYITGYG